MTAVVLTLGLGAAERGSADTVPGCANKQLCASVTDLEWASISPSTSDLRYMTDSVVVENQGTSANLVNLTVTITWKDMKGEDEIAATSSFVSSASFSDSGSSSCSLTAAQTLTCDVPKSLGPGDKITYSPLVFSTATNSAATGTTVTVKATAKEQDKPVKAGKPPSDASVTVPNQTPYEPRDDEDLSTAGGGLSTTLATANVGKQFSQLPVPSSANRNLFKLVEESCPTTGFVCLPGSQQVTTTAPGLAPVNLWITYTGSLPGGTTENSIVVVHDRASDVAPDPVTISAPCGTVLFSGQVPASIPCRTVTITRLPGGIARVDVDVWDISNGSWRFG